MLLLSSSLVGVVLPGRGHSWLWSSAAVPRVLSKLWLYGVSAPVASVECNYGIRARNPNAYVYIYIYKYVYIYMVLM